MAAGKFKCGHFLHPFPFALGEGLVVQIFPLYPFGFVTVVAPGRIFVRAGVPAGQSADSGGQKDDDAQEK